MMKKLNLAIAAFVFLSISHIVLVDVEANGLQRPTVDVTLNAYFDEENVQPTQNINGWYGSRLQVSDDLANESGYSFAFWVLDGTVRHDLSLEHEFMLTTDINIKAIFSLETEHAVMFMDTNGHLLDIQYVEHNGNATDVTAGLPDKPGYHVSVTEKWSESLDNITQNTVLILQYDRSEDAEYSLLVDGGDAITLPNGVNNPEKYIYNTIVSVVPDTAPEGMEFSHWEAEENVVSFSETYAFTMLSDRTVTAIFLENTLEETTLVSIREVSLRTGHTSYIGQFHVAPGDTLIEYGLLTAAKPVNLVFFAEASTVYKGYKYVGQTKEFLMTFPDTLLEEVLARGYIIVEDNEETLSAAYSDLVSKTTYRVDDILEIEEDGKYFFVEGVVLSAGYNIDGVLSDIFLQDKTTGNIILLQDIDGYGDVFNDGDLIELFVRMNIVETADEFYKQIALYESHFAVLESDHGVVDYRSNAIVIDNPVDYFDFLSYENRVYGAVYYITGGFFINSTASVYENTNHWRWHANPDATGVAGVRVSSGGTNTVFNVFNINANVPNLGEDWHEDLFGINEDNFPGLSYPGFLYYDGFYAILKNTSAYANWWSIVTADDFIFETEQEQIERELDEAIPESIAAGDLTLPDSHLLADETTTITWSSSHPAVIDPATGEVTYGIGDVDVTLTATYVYDSVSYNVDIEITVLSVPTMSVTDVLTDAEDNDIVRVQGIVVGFHWNGSGANVNSASNGILIKETTGNNILYVIGLYDNGFGDTLFEYDVDAHIIALGDEIEFTATYVIGTDAGFAGRPTLVIDSFVGAAMDILDTNVAYSFDLGSAITLNDNTDLANFVENLEYNQLFKLEGEFILNASSSTYGSGLNMRVAYDVEAWGDLDFDPTWHDRSQRISIKFDANIPNLGVDWWETALQIDGDNFDDYALRNNFFDATSYIYFYVGSCLPTATTSFGYIQLIILDDSWIDATRVPPEE